MYQRPLRVAASRLGVSIGLTVFVALTSGRATASPVPIPVATLTSEPIIESAVVINDALVMSIALKDASSPLWLSKLLRFDSSGVMSTIWTTPPPQRGLVPPLVNTAGVWGTMTRFNPATQLNEVHRIPATGAFVPLFASAKIDNDLATLDSQIRFAGLHVKGQLAFATNTTFNVYDSKGSSKTVPFTGSLEYVGSCADRLWFTTSGPEQAFVSDGATAQPLLLAGETSPAFIGCTDKRFLMRVKKDGSYLSLAFDPDGTRHVVGPRYVDPFTNFMDGVNDDRAVELPTGILATGSNELHLITAAADLPLADDSAKLVPLGPRALAIFHDRLAVTDGTASGTTTLAVTGPALGSDDLRWAKHGSDVYVLYMEAGNVLDLWVTNGTVAGTSKVTTFANVNTARRDEVRLLLAGQTLFITYRTQSDEEKIFRIPFGPPSGADGGVGHDAGSSSNGDAGPSAPGTGAEAAPSSGAEDAPAGGGGCSTAPPTSATSWGLPAAALSLLWLARRRLSKRQTKSRRDAPPIER